VLGWIDRIFSDKPTWQTGLWCILLVLLLGAADKMTGDELSFAVFYLVPISIAAWYSTRNLTYAVAVLATLVWLAVEYVTIEPYSKQWILFWNSAVRLLFFVVVAVLFRQLRTEFEFHERLARTDHLTGLLNRTGFMERAEALVNSASRYGLALALGFIDLDQFKNVNDTLGHAHGDEVLKTVGATLRDSSRESDIAARLGGDEFAVLLPNTSIKGAGVFFEKLHEKLVSDLRRDGGPELGVSIGAVVFEHGPPHLDEALRLADQLMYRAKKSGRISVIVEESLSAAAKAGSSQAASAVDGS
jgi:diguanylate cyclase (GGDEF)-like protein